MLSDTLWWHHATVGSGSCHQLSMCTCQSEWECNEDTLQQVMRMSNWSFSMCLRELPACL